MLRDFQVDLENQIFEAWQQPNVFNVTAVAPTGAGKTVLVSDVTMKVGQPTCAIAHRQELVSQMALAFNRDEVPHGLIAPKEVVRQIIALEHDMYGRSYYRHNADVRVAGVDTLPNHDVRDRWLSQVGLVIQDEGHHVLRDNKWGKAMQLFPNARGLFPTAHAIRADGRGLGRCADGLADALCVGPSCRTLIDRGFLTDYRLLCPDSDIDFSDVPIGATGDYSLPKLRAATHESNQIVGDVVRHYRQYAEGCLGVTFAVDIEAAKQIAAAYRAAGFPAEIITAKTPIGIRGQLMRQFRARQILQLVSVDCLGEGTDVPAIEVVSMARRTASWQLFCQQFGRGLRIMVSDTDNMKWGGYADAERLALIAASKKPRAIIIDHVGNTIYHAESRGLPDSQQEYSLERTSATRGGKGVIGYKVCAGCTQPYERFHVACPRCGYVPEVRDRSSPAAVDGDLVELTPEMLKQLRGEINRVDGDVRFPAGVSPEARGAINRRHLDRQRSQASLRPALELWGGWREHCGESTREAQKRFYLTFGLDVLTAQTLGTTEAADLEAKIRAHLSAHNIVEAIRA